MTKKPNLEDDSIGVSGFLDICKEIFNDPKFQADCKAARDFHNSHMVRVNPDGTKSIVHKSKKKSK